MCELNFISNSYVKRQTHSLKKVLNSRKKKKKQYQQQQQHQQQKKKTTESKMDNKNGTAAATMVATKGNKFESFFVEKKLLCFNFFHFL